VSSGLVDKATRRGLSSSPDTAFKPFLDESLMMMLLLLLVSLLISSCMSCVCIMKDYCRLVRFFKRKYCYSLSKEIEEVRAVKCGAITLLILNTFTHLSLRSSDPHASTLLQNSGHWVNVLISLGVTSLSALPTGQIGSSQAQPTSFFPSVSWILIFSFFFPRFFVLLPAATAAATMSCPLVVGISPGQL